MPTAICEDCQKEHHWRAQRGARLADLRCECGGRLRRAAGQSGTTTKGQRYTLCGVCGRKTIHGRTAAVPFRSAEHDQGVFPAGTLVCGGHSRLLPAGHPYFAMKDAPVSRELVLAWIAEIEAWTLKGRPDDYDEGGWTWECGIPQWLRNSLTECADDDVVVFRNTALDHLLRARGISIYDPVRDKPRRSGRGRIARTAQPSLGFSAGSAAVRCIGERWRLAHPHSLKRSRTATTAHPSSSAFGCLAAPFAVGGLRHP